MRSRLASTPVAVAIPPVTIADILGEVRRARSDDPGIARLIKATIAETQATSAVTLAEFQQELPQILVDVAQAAKMLAIGQTMMRQLAWRGHKHGGVMSIKIGRAVRIPVSELQRYLNTLALQQHGEELP